MNEEIGTTLGFVMYIPIFVYAMHTTQSHWLEAPESLQRRLVSVAAVVGAQVLSVRYLLKLSRRLRKLQAGYDCELASAEELNQLMLNGCRVFHDVLFPYGNIDHVVVSPTDVYLINAKAVGKPAQGEGKAKASVDNERRVIWFPDFTYPLPLSQLQTEVK